VFQGRYGQRHVKRPKFSTNFSTTVENLDAVPDIGEEDGIYHRPSPRDNPELIIIAYPPGPAYPAPVPIDRYLVVPLPFEVLPLDGFTSEPMP
jgi:hypothetical protein